MAGLFSTGGSKTSQPFDQQYGLWTLLSQFLPGLAEAFQGTKPKEFNNVFGKGTDPASIAEGNPMSRPFRDYNPSEYLQNLGRPPTQQEQALVDNSLFGLAAPIDLSGAQQAQGGLQQLLQQLNPGGSAFSQGYGNILQTLGKPGAGVVPPPAYTPPTPQRPQFQQGGMQTPGALAFGLGQQGPQSLMNSGGPNYLNYLQSVAGTQRPMSGY